MEDDFDKAVEETRTKLGVEPAEAEDETKPSESEENSEESKETSQEDTQDTDNSEESTDESQQEESEETEEESTESTFKKRFTQFKGDTPEEYIPNLEDAYWNSSAEALRLAKENESLKQQIDQAGDQAEQQAEETEVSETGTVDPALAYSRKELKRRMDEDYAKFKEEYPIIDRDPEIVQKLDVTARKLADLHLKETGEYMDLYDLLKMAASYMNLQPDKSEKIASAAKEQAATSKSSTGSGKPVSKDKSVFSAKQLATAEKFGLTKEQLSEFNK